MTRSPRPLKKLSDSLHQQLNMYALAASAAGVGAVALSQPTEARIVYTPIHQIIGPNTSYTLDFNHYGTVDFVLRNLWFSFSYLHAYSGFLVIDGEQGNGVRGYAVGRSGHYADALVRGAVIGPRGQFFTADSMVNATAGGACSGPWSNVRNRYVGLRFLTGGKAHFGWARLSVSCNWENHMVTAVLTGYAYETTPNKPIIAGATKGPDDAEPTASLNTPTPERATLGMLALGAPGLTIWRREETVRAR